MQLVAGAEDGAFSIKVFCFGKQLSGDSLMSSKGAFDELLCESVPGGSLVSLSKQVG